MGASSARVLSMVPHAETAKEPEPGPGVGHRWRSRCGTDVPNSHSIFCEVSVPVSRNGSGSYCHIAGHPPRLSGGLGQGSELLGLVVAGAVGAHQKPILGDLDGVVHEADPDELSRVAVADPVGRAGEAHRP
jgi:hypothetical protein